MPGYVDLRPPAVNLHFRPGDTLAVAFTFPAGYLVGKTFTSTLGAASLTVSIVGDVMTVSATGAQTAAVTSTTAWVLTETTAGGSNETMVGRWAPSTAPNDATTDSFTVNLPSGSVTVDVSGEASLTAHKADTTAHPTHVGNMTITGSLTVSDYITTGNDFFRFQGGSGMPMGGATASESNGWTGWTLVNGSTQGIGFSMSFPANWTTANMSWGFVPLASGSPRNVRWRARIRVVNALLNPDLSDALITEAVDVEQLTTQTVRNQFVLDHLFNTPAGFAVHNVGSLFGEVVHISLERIGGDAADTYAGDLMLTNFSVNRAS